MKSTNHEAPHYELLFSILLLPLSKDQTFPSALHSQSIFFPTSEPPTIK